MPAVAYHSKLIGQSSLALSSERNSLEVSSRECPQAAAGKGSGVGDGKGEVITHFNVLATSEKI